MKSQSTLRLRGFTLVELIIVIVIIGILAAIAVPQFQDVSSQAKIAAARGTASALQGAGASRLAQQLYASCNDLLGLVTPDPRDNESGATSGPADGTDETQCSFDPDGSGDLAAVDFYNAAGSLPPPTPTP